MKGETEPQRDANAKPNSLDASDAHDVRDEPDKARLQPLLENPKPVAEQNFFDFLVIETALNQFTSEIARVGMVL
jgi:hypothetical protein